MMVIDTHPHLLAEDVEKYPVDPLGGVQSDWSKGMHVTGRELLDAMDAAGVDKAVLVQASTFHGYDNSFIVDEAARYRDRFVGVCCVDPRADDAPETVDYWVMSGNMQGVRIFSSGSTVAQADWFDDHALDPFWRRVSERGVPVNAQISFGGLGMLKNVMDRFPTITFILDHLANPPIDDGPPYASSQPLLELAAYPQLFLKFTNNNLRRAKTKHASVASFFALLIGSFGAERLMWGSNYPSTRTESTTPYRDLVQEMTEDLAPFDDETRSWLVGGTALRLYPALA